MIKVEYYERGEFLITYRIIPAFMSDGFRVFRKREYEKDETWSFNERIFESEIIATQAVTDVLNKHIALGLIQSYTVTNTRQ